MTLSKRMVAELLGTCWLVFGGCGAAVFAAAFPQVGIGLLGVSLAFALEEAAGDPSGRVGVLAVVDGQRQEVARHGARLHAGGGEDDGIAEADDARAVGLFGDVAGLERKTLRADLDGSLRFH